MRVTFCPMDPAPSPPHPPALLAACSRTHSRTRLLCWLLAITAVAALGYADHRWLFRDGQSVYHAMHTQVVQVAEVRGADLLLVRTPHWHEPLTLVRVMGIEASAQTALRPPPQALQQQARELTLALVLGQNVELLLEPHQSTDRQGRVLAHVVLPDGRLLAQVLLERGLAQVDRTYSHGHFEYYETLFQAARLGQPPRRDDDQP